MVSSPGPWAPRYCPFAESGMVGIKGPMAAKYLYLILAGHANVQGGKVAYPSLKALRELMGCSKRTVEKAKEWLLTHGPTEDGPAWIEQSKAHNNKFEHNVYILPHLRAGVPTHVGTKRTTTAVQRTALPQRTSSPLSAYPCRHTPYEAIPDGAIAYKGMVYPEGMG